MHVNHILNLMLFMISIIATCVLAENQAEEYSDNKVSRKREAAVIIDNYPLDTIISKKPQVVVRRISKQKGRNSKSRYYRSPKRARPGKYSKTGKKTGSPKLKRVPATWTPYKKNKKTFKTYKQGIARGPIHSPRKTYKSKRKNKLNNNKRHIYNPLRPVGFGEPPLDYGSLFNPPEPGPPVDSYGEPLFKDPYSLDSAPGFDYDIPHDADNRYAFSNIQSKVVLPDVNAFDNPVLMDLNDNNIGAYPHIFNMHKKKQNSNVQLNRRPVADDDFYVQKEQTRERHFDDHEVVGGQYAEPPARYVPKSHQKDQFDDYEEFSPPHIFVSSKFAPSASISPYVNYKNGNIAFSPQNLNDAFSIVDK